MISMISTRVFSQMTQVIMPSLTTSVCLNPLRRMFSGSAEKITYIKDDATYYDLKKGAKPSIMNYSASWCGPCKKMAPKFSALSLQHDGVNFVKIDVDVSQNIANEEKIMSVPTYKLFKNDKLITEFAGADVSQLSVMIEMAKKA